MDFAEYQRRAAETDTPAGTQQGTRLEIYVLGLAGEAGSVAAEYKKRLRDWDAHSRWRPRITEELGDVLWYLSAIAGEVGLGLEQIASDNLVKTRGRWLTGPQQPLDGGFPDTERLPRQGEYTFVPVTGKTGRPAVELWFDGERRGDVLTDAAAEPDGYRFHDVFHLSYAALLGWSPVTRALLDRKRRSDPAVDENEDGGRAVVVEEGIAALVFGYAAQHHYLAEITRLDQRLLDTIALLTSTTEARIRSAGAWEHAILAGFDCFRALIAHGGGSVRFDADRGSLDYNPPCDQSAADCPDPEAQPPDTPTSNG
jgi:NTP pyrophosphatase (non-canonical NTP hydrolase)